MSIGWANQKRKDRKTKKRHRGFSKTKTKKR
jgi:hypothetical protein